ncbi:MAG: hypothetical protein ABIR30_07460 [Chitinophagaceae bacterium]
MKFFLAAMFCWISCFPVNAQNTEVPAELKPFILKGYESLDFVKEDLNGDKLSDYLLILKVLGEDTLTYENANWEAARPFLLILRQPDGSLKQAVRNNELVGCKQCGGSMGDPYQGLTVKAGEFTADFYGGSSWRWTAGYTFRYDKIKKDWFLQAHTSSSFHAGDPDKTMEESIITRTEIGDISLQQFTPYYNVDSNEWKVTAVRTYFYSSPAIGSKPKKAYVVKGNTISSSKQFKHFIEAAFTNSKGNTTYGFILKKDLVLLKPNTPQATR